MRVLTTRRPGLFFCCATSSWIEGAGRTGFICSFYILAKVCLSSLGSDSFTYLGQIIDRSLILTTALEHYSSAVHDLDLPGRADRWIPDLYDLYDLYDLAHIAGWEAYNLHHLGQDSWVGSVLCRSCATHHIGRLGFRSSRS